MRLSLRSMDWDERIWLALRRAAISIPLSVRMEAVLTVIRTSEEEAKRRGSDIVEEVDLVRAVKKRVPPSVRPMSFVVLREQGIDLDKY